MAQLLHVDCHVHCHVHCHLHIPLRFHYIDTLLALPLSLTFRFVFLTSVTYEHDSEIWMSSRAVYDI